MPKKIPSKSQKDASTSKRMQQVTRTEMDALSALAVRRAPGRKGKCDKILECGQAEDYLEIGKLYFEIIRKMIQFLDEHEKWLEWLTTDGRHHICNFVPRGFCPSLLADEIGGFALRLSSVVENIKSKVFINHARDLQNSP